MTIIYDILASVRERLDTNRNWLCIIAGDTGSGKSYTALKIGEMLGPTFDISHVIFSPLELIRAIDKATPKQVLVMDEAGTQFGARDFMKKENKVLGEVFQMFRFKQVAIIWTLPDMAMLDITARRLAHTYLETVSVDYEKEISRVKWFNISVNRWSGEFMHKYPRLWTKNGQSVIKIVGFEKPTEKLLKKYEEKKVSAFDEVIKYCENVMGGGEKSGKKRKSTAI